MANKAGQRSYTVVAITEAGDLRVLDLSVPGRRQEEACDKVVAELPAAERTGRFAAFLRSSYREFEYETEATVVTHKRRVDAGAAVPATA